MSREQWTHNDELERCGEMENGIKKKGNFGQFLCRHKNTSWYLKKEPFFILSGERKYEFCNDCGKQMNELFIRHD